MTSHPVPVDSRRSNRGTEERSDPGTTLTTKPALTREEASELSFEESVRWIALLTSLSPSQWGRATECDLWTVRDVAAHVLGNHDGLASMRERLHQLRQARRRGGNLVDALSATQVEDRRGLTTDELVQRLRRSFDQSIRARRRLPATLMRRVRIQVPMRDRAERWSSAYLDDVIYTRDAWMHRMDVCRAVDIQPHLTPGHDGRIVAGIAHEWADRHGLPYRLELTGPAGGTFGDEACEDRFTLDAVDFSRNVSGRGAPTGLLAVEVGF